MLLDEVFGSFSSLPYHQTSFVGPALLLLLSSVYRGTTPMPDSDTVQTSRSIYRSDTPLT